MFKTGSKLFHIIAFMLLNTVCYGTEAFLAFTEAYDDILVVTKRSLRYIPPCLLKTHLIDVRDTGLCKADLEYLRYARHVNIGNYDHLKRKALKYPLRQARTIHAEQCDALTSETFQLFKNAKYINLFFCESLTDDDLQYFPRARDIDLSWTNINGSGFPYLKKVHTLSLQNCPNVNPTYLSHLTNVRHIDLTGIYLEDSDLEHFGNARSICITSNAVTDVGLAHLKKVKKISIRSYNITDEGLPHLRNADNISLNGSGICGTGFTHLINAQVVSLHCQCLEEENLHHLRHIKALALEDYPKKVDTGFSQLKGLRTMILEGNIEFTERALQDLGHVKTVTLKSCPQIWGQRLRHFEQATTVSIDKRDNTNMTFIDLRHLKGIQTLNLIGYSPHL